MASNISRYKFHILIVTIGFLWFGLVDYLLQLGLQTGVYFDAENYKDAAELLYHHGQLHFYRPMIIAAYCGIPYAFGGSDTQVYAFGIYLNFACWIGTALLLFGLLKSIVIEKMAFYYTLCFFAVIGPMLSVFHLLTESCYTFTMMAGFYLLSKYYDSRQFYYLPAALAIFVGSMLIKPGSQYLAILFVLYFGKVLIANYSKRSMFILYASIVLIALQACGMKKQYGNYTISYISGPTFYNYLGARAFGLQKHETIKEIQRYRMPYIFGLDFPQQQSVGFADLKKQLLHNTSNFIIAYGINLSENTKTPSDCLTVCRNVKGTRHFEFYNYAAEILTKWQNRLLTISGFLLGLWFLFTRYRKAPLYALAGFYIVYTVLLSGLSCFQGDRFHLVFFPVAILLFAKFATFKANKKLNI